MNMHKQKKVVHGTLEDTTAKKTNCPPTSHLKNPRSLSNQWGPPPGTKGYCN
jgi:hypothetical protein